ncbi:metallophosphoesterase [Carboxylicivirga marina]|uniref:metallophosphoesterase n=1 Tax=Carboxylicivirga marina TaxID=2800988 RepID=UPI0025968D9D|nr:metallophosphoesterase [uncultured Carboxylicivirga sp.]
MKKNLVYLFVVLLMGCSTVKAPYYSAEEKDWLKKERLKKTVPIRTLFVVGDAGQLDNEARNQNYVLTALERQLKDTNSPVDLVFLGDNIYPQGLPSKNHDTRTQSESILNAQLKLAEFINGNTYFIAGNHDWKRGKKGGLKRVKRQEKFVEEFGDSILNKKVKFYPGDGCGEPKVIKVDKDLVYVFVDSQWWLQNWDVEKKMNRGCDIRTRGDFLVRMEEVFMSYKNDEVVVFMHHPLKSNGTHGGYFAAKHHIFPLHELNSKLWIPLPGLGSVYPIFRQTTGSVQDLSHHLYQDMVNGLSDAAKRWDVDVTFVSGHEHNLQYFDDEEIKQIISGSGSKISYVAAGGEAEFTLEARGYVKIDFYKNAEAWIEYYTVADKDASPVLEFRQQMRELKAGSEKTEITYLPVTKKDTVVAANKVFEGSKTMKRFLGEQYRSMWATEVKAPFINLETKHGGLEPIKKGGGMSSNSLRMEKADGQQYILRSINKDYTKLVEPKFANLKALNIMKDQNSASHPYGALMIPSLSEAAGVYSTQPELVYLKHQRGLGNYNAFFPEEVYLLEQRPSGNWGNADYFGNSNEIIGYTDLLENLREKKTHFVDQEWVLKSRLFDLFIHDWDRHDDQWRWASFTEDGRTLYRPIPRDRDQVFYKFEGFIPWYVSTFLMKKFKTMKGDVRDVKHLSFNARYFDRYFLNELEWSEWEKIAKKLQAAMTDEVIDASLQGLPPEVRVQNKEVIDLLKERRENMLKISRKLYDFINAEVEITGTDNDDRFEIIRLDDGRVEISYFVERKSKGDLLKYKRTFDPDETKEVRLYGLRGKDEFIISGADNSAIRIRIIGGEDKDKIINQSNSKAIFAYDNSKGIKIDGDNIKERTSNDVDINEYDRYGFKYNTNLPFLRGGYTLDDGVWLGLTHTWTRHAWRQEPYKSKQMAAALIAPGSQDAFIVMYEGHFPNLFKNVDFYPSLSVDYPSIENFFGYGNESINHDLEKQYNWVRKRAIKAEPLISFRSRNSFISLKFGPTFESVKIEDTDGRVWQDPDIGFSDEELSRHSFVGGKAVYSVNFVDRESKPTNGIRYNASLAYQDDMTNTNSLWIFDTNLQTYLTLTNHPQLVLANNVGYQTISGEAQFYQYPNLGNRTNLRGFRNNRFRGDKVFYENLDLRLQLIDWDNRYVPMDIGVLGGFDVGRVWLDDETSDRWHHSQTIGMWMDVLELVVMQPYYSYTKEGHYFSFRMSYNF